MARLVIAVTGMLAMAGKVDAGVLAVGDPATEFDVAVDRANKPIKLAAFRGRWLVIAVGASWCKPCAAELPKIDAIARQYAGRATFIALAQDDPIADGIAFHSKLGLANMLRVYLNPSISKIADRYGEAFPITLVIDPKGVVAFAIYGYDKDKSMPKLRGTLDTLLPKPTPKPTPSATKPPAPPAKPPQNVTPVPTLVLPDRPRTALWAPGWSVSW